MGLQMQPHFALNFVPIFVHFCYVFAKLAVRKQIIRTARYCKKALIHKETPVIVEDYGCLYLAGVEL